MAATASRVSAALLALWLTGCGSGLLVALTTGEAPFPPKKIVRGALALRATGPLINDLLGNITRFVPELVTRNQAGWACLNLDLLLQDGTIAFPLSLGPLEGNLGGRDLEVCLDLQRLHIELVPETTPARVRLSADHLGIALSHPAVFFGDVSLLGADVSAACLVDNDLTGPDGSPYLASVSFVAEAELGVQATGAFDVSAVTSSLSLHDVGVTVLEDCSLPECTDPNPGGACLECSICDVANFGSDLLEFVQGALGSLLDPLLTQVVGLLLPPILDTALNDRPISISTEIALGNLLGALTRSARDTTPLALMLRPAPDGFVVTGVGDEAGLEIRLDGGTAATRVHPCAEPLGSEPVFVPGPRPLLGALTPQGAPYDLAVALSEAFFNQLFWSLRATGALCLALDETEIRGLTASFAGTPLSVDVALLDLLVPGLSALTGPGASVRVVLDPRITSDQLPIARVTAPANGPARVPIGGEAAPLGAIELHLDDVRIGLEAWLGGRYVRVVSLGVALRAGIDVVAEGSKLRLALGKVEIVRADVLGDGLASTGDTSRLVDLGVEVLVAVLGQATSTAFELDVSALTDLFGDLPYKPELRYVGPTGTSADWLGVWVALTPVQTP